MWPDVRAGHRFSPSDLVPGILAIALLGAALGACPVVPRAVLQATKLALLYVFARG